MPNFAWEGRRPVSRSLLRPLMGLVTVVVIVAAFALAANLFRGGFTDSVPVTVMSGPAW
jgi:phospholipid/cholesterol/gamma-HCH transport system substrate-binding protein